MGNAPSGTNTKVYRDISENLTEVATLYGYKDGYFGEKSVFAQSNKDKWKRNIFSESKEESVRNAENFFLKISEGAKFNREDISQNFYDSENPRILSVRTFADGTKITYRSYSSSDNTPVVEIDVIPGRYKGVKRQKIHFMVR